MRNGAKLAIPATLQIVDMRSICAGTRARIYCTLTAVSSVTSHVFLVQEDGRWEGTEMFGSFPK